MTAFPISNLFAMPEAHAIAKASGNPVVSTGPGFLACFVGLGDGLLAIRDDPDLAAVAQQDPPQAETAGATGEWQDSPATDASGASSAMPSQERGRPVSVGIFPIGKADGAVLARTASRSSPEPVFATAMPSPLRTPESRLLPRVPAHPDVGHIADPGRAPDPVPGTLKPAVQSGISTAQQSASPLPSRSDPASAGQFAVGSRASGVAGGFSGHSIGQFGTEAVADAVTGEARMASGAGPEDISAPRPDSRIAGNGIESSAPLPKLMQSSPSKSEAQPDRVPADQPVRSAIRDVSPTALSARAAEPSWHLGRNQMQESDVGKVIRSSELAANAPLAHASSPFRGVDKTSNTQLAAEPPNTNKVDGIRLNSSRIAVDRTTKDLPARVVKEKHRESGPGQMPVEMQQPPEARSLPKSGPGDGSHSVTAPLPVIGRIQSATTIQPFTALTVSAVMGSEAGRRAPTKGAPDRMPDTGRSGMIETETFALHGSDALGTTLRLTEPHGLVRLGGALPLGPTASGPAAGSSHLSPAQVVETIVRNIDRQVEVALNPEELGRVRMSLSTSDTGVTLQISAERQDTLDLMRRHIETLASEFRRLGFETVGFDFSGGSTGRQGQTGQGQPATVDQSQDLEIPVPQVVANAAAQRGGLDLRL